jgi:hypothetical protein
MPVAYTYDEEQGLLTTTFEGAVTDDELEQHVREVSGDPRVGPGVRELIDLRAVTKVKVTVKGLRYVIANDRKFADKFKDERQAVVTTNDLIYGMARMYQMMSNVNAGPSTIKIFREYDAAMTWLMGTEGS